jgi:hypothetical protein
MKELKQDIYGKYIFSIVAFPSFIACANIRYS